ncbi:MAG TPA: hypothetical protein VFH26_04995 [Gemmatimonadales bacterium]|nr:hypothetical protein [Gemmatimonadales bacterium]
MSQAKVPLSYPVFRSLARWLPLCAVAACGHTEPFTPRNFNTDQPFNPTPPAQLTLNQGPDRRAAWLPDGSAILYSSQQWETEDKDVCLAVLPPTGGRQRARTCTFSSDGDNFTESFESAAAQTDGRLAYVGATSFIDALGPNQEHLVLASLADPIARNPLLSLPYTIPGRRTHRGISQLHWLSPDRLLYLGENVILSTPCQFCQMDTLRSGLDAVSLSLAGTPGAPQAIPGTENASGVSPGGNPDEIYYTLNGDTRVYRQVLSTGEVIVAHDFGIAGIARDVHVVEDRLTAVVGGRVHFADDPALGPTQWDSGGVVHVVRLSDGSDTPLAGPDPLELYRRPRLSPGGTKLVAERYPLNRFEVRGPEGDLIRVDTVVARAGDLYLFGQP